MTGFRPGLWTILFITRTASFLFAPVGRYFATHPQARWWSKIFRLGLIQFGIGLTLAPISGTLNRVLITDMNIPAVAVGFLISLHYFISPVRAMVGYRSDKARSEGHWRTPYVVFGVMLTFGGLVCAIQVERHSEQRKTAGGVTFGFCVLYKRCNRAFTFIFFTRQNPKYGVGC